MFETPFYWGTIRKAVVAFGQMFSDIKIERKDNTGTTQQKIKVPIAYGPKEKWLRRLQENPDGKKSVSTELPRLTFEIVDYRYDPERKAGANPVYFKSPDGQNKKFATPVPYNVTFVLYVITNTQEDALMIIEQVLPFFAPGVVVEFDALTDPLTRTDVTFSLSGVNIQDNWDGSMEDQRFIIHELTFDAKLYLFGPVSQPKVIKKAIADINPVNNINTKPSTTYTAAVTPSTANQNDTYTIIDNWTN